MKTPEERIAKACCDEFGTGGCRCWEFDMMHGTKYELWEGKILPLVRFAEVLAADAKRAREEADKALAERNEFRDASGLLVGGDPEGVTPEILQKFIMRQDAFIRAWHKCARGWRASHLQESFKLGRAAGARERMQHERNQAIERAEKAEQERDRLKAEIEALKTERTQVLRAQQIGLQDKARQMALPPEGLAVLLGIDSKTAWSDGCPRMAFRSYMITLGAYAAYIEFGGTPIEADLEQPLPAAPTESP